MAGGGQKRGELAVWRQGRAGGVVVTVYRQRIPVYVLLLMLAHSQLLEYYTTIYTLLTINLKIIPSGEVRVRFKNR